MHIPPLASDISQIIENIQVYNKAIDGVNQKLYRNHQVTNMISYVQSWYALENGNKGYLFGPSKFIGYSGITPEFYQNRHADLDGRPTERQLRQWTQPIGQGDKRYAELRSALAAFCARFGVHPNGRARISLLSSLRSQPQPLPGDAEHIQAILMLIARLPPKAREEIKRCLAHDPIGATGSL